MIVAGPDTDRLVATEFMRWEPTSPGGVYWKKRGATVSRLDWRYAVHVDQSAHLRRWAPSTDIAHAWVVVERIRPYIKVDGRGDGQGQWSCSIWNGGPEIVAYGDLAPIAICRAVLAGMGIH